MNLFRKAIIGGALIASTVAGGALGATVVGTAYAQSDPSSTATAPAADDPGSHDPTQGGHTRDGVTEELLTGDTAEKVTAAALEAVPGGTVQRVETDAEGDAYEAHMTDADGKDMTVKFDADFKVTATEEGGRPR